MTENSSKQSSNSKRTRQFAKPDQDVTTHAGHDSGRTFLWPIHTYPRASGDRSLSTRDLSTYLGDWKEALGLLTVWSGFHYPPGWPRPRFTIRWNWYHLLSSKHYFLIPKTKPKRGMVSRTMRKGIQRELGRCYQGVFQTVLVKVL